MVEERPVDVALHDIGFQSSVLMSFSTLHNFVNLIHCGTNLDPIASVGVFAWLYDPNVLADVSLIRLRQGLQFHLIIGSFDVESDGDMLEYIHFLLLVVVSEVIEEGLLVSKMEIVLQVVMALIKGGVSVNCLLIADVAFIEGIVHGSTR